jgi:hypothetical protein
VTTTECDDHKGFSDEYPTVPIIALKKKSLQLFPREFPSFLYSFSPAAGPNIIGYGLPDLTLKTNLDIL